MQILRERLEGTQAQVAKPLLDAADVGAVVTEAFCELLLTEAEPLPVCTHVPTEHPLQVTFHRGHTTRDR